MSKHGQDIHLSEMNIAGLSHSETAPNDTTASARLDVVSGCVAWHSVITSAVERRSLSGVLSLSCPALDL